MRRDWDWGWLVTNQVTRPREGGGLVYSAQVGEVSMEIGFPLAQTPCDVGAPCCGSRCFRRRW